MTSDRVEVHRADIVGAVWRAFAAHQHGQDGRAHAGGCGQKIGFARARDQGVKTFAPRTGRGLGGIGDNADLVAERLQHVGDGRADAGRGNKDQEGFSVRRRHGRFGSGAGKGRARLTRNGQGEPEIGAVAFGGFKADFAARLFHDAL